jgi:hypothetical protein
MFGIYRQISAQIVNLLAYHGKAIFLFFGDGFLACSAAGEYYGRMPANLVQSFLY